MGQTAPVSEPKNVVDFILDLVLCTGKNGPKKEYITSILAST